LIEQPQSAVAISTSAHGPGREAPEKGLGIRRAIDAKYSRASAVLVAPARIPQKWISGFANRICANYFRACPENVRVEKCIVQNDNAGTQARVVAINL